MKDTTRSAGPARNGSARGPDRATASAGRPPGRAHETPIWAQVVSQPGELEERRADARAAQILQGPGGAAPPPDDAGRPTPPPPTPTPRNGAHLPDGAPAPVLAQAGRGRPLDPAERGWFGPRLGGDPAHVRIHTGPQAEALAEAADARAFTVGSHVFFNRGEYRPGTPAGRALLAHELAHTEQAPPAPGGPARLWRQPKGKVTDDLPTIVDEPDEQQPETWAGLVIPATGMDEAAQKLSKVDLKFESNKGRPLVFVGLDREFVKVYDATGKSLGSRVRMKEAAKEFRLRPGVWMQTSTGHLSEVQESSHDPNRMRHEATGLGIAYKPLTPQQKKAIEAEVDKALKEGRTYKPPPNPPIVFETMMTEPGRYASMVSSVPNAVIVFFVPQYIHSGAGKGAGGQPAPYASPIPGRGDGKPANAPPWPVRMEGPKLAPKDSNPTFTAKVDWAANAYTSNVLSMMTAQMGESIHYQWELFDVTKYAKEQAAQAIAAEQAAIKEAAAREAAAAKQAASTAAAGPSTGGTPAGGTSAGDPAVGAASDPAPVVDPLKKATDELAKSGRGSGTDVTGMGGADREFDREFEDLGKDTKRAAQRLRDLKGGTTSEKMTNAWANVTALQLLPVSALVTTVGASLRWAADLFAVDRQQQEIPLEQEGTYLVRVISTPTIQEDDDGKEVIRPPSLAAMVVEVTSMEKAVTEALGEADAQIDEIKAQIAAADEAGAEKTGTELRWQLAEAELRFQGSPHDLLLVQYMGKIDAQLAVVTKEGDTDRADVLRKLRAAAQQRFTGSSLARLSPEQQAWLIRRAQERENVPLSHYARERELELLADQIAIFERHAGKVAPGASLQRLNATLVSEVTAGPVPLLLSAAPMPKDGDTHVWLVSDVTNREGRPYVGRGTSPSAALQDALEKFGGDAAYGRGRIGVRTAGLALEDGADPVIYADSAHTDWALAEKRIDDLVMTLAILGLTVASAGTAGAIIGAGLAAVRLIQRWSEGRLYLDAQTIGDALGLLGGVTAGLQLAGGLKVVKLDQAAGTAKGAPRKAFAVVADDAAVDVAKASEAVQAGTSFLHGVEMANEVLNYGGVLWGNITFLDQIISINAQEASGAMTHAEARRARANAFAGAVQNNGLFIAGNVLKAKGKARAQDNEALLNKAKAEETKSRSAGEPPARPAVAELLPGRQATLAEMQAGLPSDLHKLVKIDTDLHGDAVHVTPVRDGAGNIVGVTVRCSPDARPRTVQLHEATIRAMQRAQGFMGRVRRAIAWVADAAGIDFGEDVDRLDPADQVAFNAALEVRKLPKLIEEQVALIEGMEPNAAAEAEVQLDNLRDQLDKALITLEHPEYGDASQDFVAAKGLTKAQKARLAELRAKKKTLTPLTDEHQAVRWEMYKITHNIPDTPANKQPTAAWLARYKANQTVATDARKAELHELNRLGWGRHQVRTTVPGSGETRIFDIAEDTGKVRRAVEVKKYASELVRLTSDIEGEVNADAKLKRYAHWDITWLFVDCVAHPDLLAALHKAKITVKYRTTGQAERVQPPDK